MLPKLGRSPARGQLCVCQIPKLADLLEAAESRMPVTHDQATRRVPPIIEKTVASHVPNLGLRHFCHPELCEDLSRTTPG